MANLRKKISKRKINFIKSINRLKYKGGWRRFRTNAKSDNPPVHDQLGNKEAETTKPKRKIKQGKPVQGDLHRRHK